MRQGPSAVRSFLLAAEHPHDAALRVKLDDHVRAFVDGPDIIVLINADTMRFRPGIQTLADFARKIAALIELEQLRRRRAKSGAGRTV